MASQAEQLERETDKVRAELSQTLDELRQRMTPGQLIDQAIDYTRDGEAAAMVGNLRRQVVEKPLALTLIGAGLAWLMIPGRGGRGGDGAWADDTGGLTRDQIAEAGDAAADRLRRGAATGAETFSETRNQTAESIAAARQRMADSASAAGEAVSERYAQLAGTAGDAASQVRRSISSLGGSMSSLTHNVATTTGNARQTFLEACREQPLILAGLGLAIGAAIGAMLPRSEQEDRLMGPVSDDVKESVQAFAGEKMEEAKESVAATAGEIEKTASASEEAPSIIPLPDETSSVDTEREVHDPAHGVR